MTTLDQNLTTNRTESQKKQEEPWEGFVDVSAPMKSKERGYVLVTDKLGRPKFDNDTLLGYSNNGTHLSPMHMLFIFREYERLLSKNNYYDTLRIEEENGYPETWLNGVSSTLDMDVHVSVVREFFEQTYRKCRV